MINGLNEAAHGVYVIFVIDKYNICCDVLQHDTMIKYSLNVRPLVTIYLLSSSYGVLLVD